MPSRASRLASAGPTPLSDVTARRSSVTGVTCASRSRYQDAVDLDRRATRQRGRADRHARRVRLAEELLHDLVDRGKVAEVCEVDGHAHGSGKARARGLGNGGEIREDAPRFSLD